MSLVSEKRTGRDRRVEDVGPPDNFGERRQSIDRRQTDVSEISFFEWASFFVKYQGRAVADAHTLRAAHAAEVLDRSRR